MKKVIEAYSLTKMGRLHDRNEDACHLNVESRLIVLADGMGGHQAGKVASSLATRVVAEQFHGEGYRKEASLRASTRPIIGRLKDSVLLAHQLLKRAQKEHPEELTGMGCALTAIRWGWKYWHIAHVGDTKVYAYSKGALRKLTHDHTAAASLVKAGHISAEDAIRHPLRHQLTQALGQEDIKPELLSVPMAENQGKPSWLVVCSDGVWDALGEEGMVKILDKSRSPRTACRGLVESAWEADGRDDCTAMVAKIYVLPGSQTRATYVKRN